MIFILGIICGILITQWFYIRKEKEYKKQQAFIIGDLAHATGNYFKNKCSCGKVIDKDIGVCDDCRKKLEFLKHHSPYHYRTIEELDKDIDEILKPKTKKMSNFQRKTINPKTGKLEMAKWLDNHYGIHHYAVEFLNGSLYSERELDPLAEIAEMKAKRKIKPVPKVNYKNYYFEGDNLKRSANKSKIKYGKK